MLSSLVPSTYHIYWAHDQFAMRKLRLRLESWANFHSHTPGSATNVAEQGSDRSPTFIYSSLPPGTIRVLSPDVKRESPGSAWCLKTVKLDDRLKFDALSYTWGSQDDTFPISLNRQCFRVHHNLFSALPYLARRRKGNDRQLPIWIDAICINQSDKEEVAVQVAFMHRIYRQARTVWVWLELGNEVTQAKIPEAISLLENIALAGEERLRTYPRRCGDVEADFGLCGLEPAVLDAIVHLLSNSWFGRVWIIQEAALARDWIFLCGAHQIDPEALSAAAENAFFLETKDALDNEIKFRNLDVWHNHGVFKIRSFVQRTLAHPNLNTEGELLMRVCHTMMVDQAQCFLPRDRVCGVLGLCENSALLDENIHHVSDVDRMYTLFSRHLLFTVDPHAGPLWWDWLDLAFTQQRMPTLPSWVPDLHQGAIGRTQYRLAIMFAFSKMPKFQASRAKTGFRLGENVDELWLRGKILSKISHVLDPLPHREPVGLDRMKILASLCTIADWVEAAEAHVLGQRRENEPTDKLSNRADDLENYWKAILGISEDDENLPDQWLEIRDGLKRAREIAAKFNVALGASDEMAPSDYQLVSRIWDLPLLGQVLCLSERQLFWTEENSCGFTRPGVRQGDSVCVFSGAEFVHVIRRAVYLQDGVEGWRFVGSAFVHGLMYGEADGMDMVEEEICLL